MGIFRKIIRRLLRFILNLFSFEWYQRHGYHVLSNHYYSPVPDTSKLVKADFEKIIPLNGIDIRENEQLDLISQFSVKYRKEYDAFPSKQGIDAYIFHTGQTSFRSVDSQVLYCMVRSLRPKKMLEVGSGFSTMLSAQAIVRNNDEGYPCDFCAIEPYPNRVIEKGFPGLSELLRKPVQAVPMAEFSALVANDILFLDSSHTVKTGGDVNFEILEILPSLAKGVYIHIHDVFIPYEYPQDWILKGQRFWAEQYLLNAFLLYNDSFRIKWMSHYMHRNHSEKLRELMNFYEPGIPYVSSFWMQKVK